MNVETAQKNGYVGLATSTVLPGATLLARVLDNDLELYPYDVDSMLLAEHMYNAGVKTVVSTCLVKHAPAAENVTANALTWFTRLFNDIYNFFAKLFRQMSMQMLFNGFKNSLGLG